MHLHITGTGYFRLYRGLQSLEFEEKPRRMAERIQNTREYYGIDTRALTKILREQGTMLGKIIYNDEKIDFYDPNKDNLVKQVSIGEKKVYGNGKYRILLVDCGVKYNIIRNLLKRDTTVVRCALGL